MVLVLLIGLLAPLTHDVHAAHAQNLDLLKTQLLTSESVVSVEEYVADNFDELPEVSRFGLDKPWYDTVCVDRFKKSQEQYEYYKVQYLSDGLKVYGIVAMPVGWAEQKKNTPLVLFNRGGNREFGRLFTCGISQVTMQFGHQGRYAVFMPQLRGVAGGEGYDEFGGADVHDALQLLEVGRAMPAIDKQNIFIAGWSRGGMTTYLMLKNGARVNAAIVVAGVADLPAVLRMRPDFRDVYLDLVPNYRVEPEQTLSQRSAVDWPEKITLPVMIVHGDQDERVPFESAVKMQKLLADTSEARGLTLQHQFVVYPGGDHSLHNFKAALTDEINSWYEKHTAASTFANHGQ